MYCMYAAYTICWHDLERQLSICCHIIGIMGHNCTMVDKLTGELSFYMTSCDGLSLQTSGGDFAKVTFLITELKCVN